MMQRIFSYWRYTVKPWDFWRTELWNSQKRSQKVFNIGFCAVFPPFPNGAAAGTYYFLRAFAQSKLDVFQGGDVALYLLPIKNKIDKKLFSFMPLRFTRIDNLELDVVILWCLGGEVAAYTKRSSPRTKTIAWQTMHADPALELKEQRMLDSVKQADLVLGVTRWAKTCYGKQISHVDYLPFGTDPELFSPNQNKVQKKPFTCLFVSRLHYAKGIMPLLDAIQIVLKKDPSIQFQLIGPLDIHSPYLREIQERLAQVKKIYSENVTVKTTWTSYEEIPSFYKQADLLLFPSTFEGFGIPLIEAMSSQIPCIVLDKKPMNELVVDGRTGYCLKASQKSNNYHGLEFPDPEEIAAKILALKNNKKLREEMGKKGRERVLAKYNFSQIIPQLIKHCRDLANKNEFKKR